MGFEFVKHCINDVKASFYKCYFLPVIIFREANALGKFVAPLRFFVYCCNNKNSLVDSIRDVWRKEERNGLTFTKRLKDFVDLFYLVLLLLF